VYYPQDIYNNSNNNNATKRYNRGDGPLIQRLLHLKAFGNARLLRLPLLVLKRPSAFLFAPLFAGDVEAVGVGVGVEEERASRVA
jgi:hypothetical protein